MNGRKCLRENKGIWCLNDKHIIWSFWSLRLWNIVEVGEDVTIPSSLGFIFLGIGSSNTLLICCTF